MTRAGRSVEGPHWRAESAAFRWPSRASWRDHKGRGGWPKVCRLTFAPDHCPSHSQVFFLFPAISGRGWASWATCCHAIEQHRPAGSLVSVVLVRFSEILSDAIRREIELPKVCGNAGNNGNRQTEAARKGEKGCSRSLSRKWEQWEQARGGKPRASVAPRTPPAARLEA